MFRTSCLICGLPNLDRIIELGMHPFADTFISEARLSESEPVYPLSCDLCADCGQIQTSCVTDPAQRYSLYDYSYTSSNSSFSRNHWTAYAEHVAGKLHLAKGSFVIEVGSNDGFLAERFQEQGHKVLGVDPSEYMASLAKEREVETLVGFFGRETARKVRSVHGKAKLVVANNVFNHSNEPADFAKAASEILDVDGTFVFELPYWLSGMEAGKFDQIYHEHVSYFTVTSSLAVLKQAGLGISDVELVDYHGGSIRVFAKPVASLAGESENAMRMMQAEREWGLFDLCTYDNFMTSILGQRSDLLGQIHRIKAEGKPVIAVGAAAKGNTFLNFYNMDNTVIDYVTDVSMHKQGKYTPLTRIPIRGDSIFAYYDDVHALILSWNISDKIKETLAKINPNIKFLFLPKAELVKDLSDAKT